MRTVTFYTYNVVMLYN